MRQRAPHFPPTTLLCVEDTSNRGGGKVQPLENTDRLCEVAREHDLRLHLDGARLWHAVVASGVPLQAEYVVIGGHGDHNIDRPFCGT